jgi:methyl-accepting chemotaxis protein
MKLDEALLAHVRWSMQFKQAIEREETLDIATISAADRCELGNWLHGEAQTKYGSLDAYTDCVAKHDQLHRVAGQLAQEINAGDSDEATTMLHDGSPYAEASIELGAAMHKLREEVSGL